MGLTRWRRWAAAAAAGGALAVSGGCATYSSGFQATETALLRHQPDTALQALEARRPAKRDRVLYLLNKAMLLRMTGQYAASNRGFEEAKRLDSQLRAVSLREQSESFVINDATRSYVSEEYEQVLAHLYEALNYIALGRLDDARVEAGQIDLELQAYHDRFSRAGYTQDAFARYLNGVIYEDLGETSDAMIAYRKAYEAYQGYARDYGVAVPRFLQRDLLRLSGEMGLDDEQGRYARAFGIDPRTAARDSTKGELVFILSDGLAPIKRQHSILVPNPHSGRLIRISLPFYQRRTTGATRASVTADGKRADAAVMEDVSAIAEADLRAKMPAITARAIARAVVKAKLADEADEHGNPLLGLAVNIAGIVTEVADTRSWLTLPDNIQLARLALDPGTYTVKVELYGAGGGVVHEQTFPGVQITAGHMAFLTYDWI